MFFEEDFEEFIGKASELYDMLMELPPRLESVEEELKDREYSEEELTTLGCKFVRGCHSECSFFEDEHGRKPKKEELHSVYIYEIINLLLRYGLNPNLVLGELLYQFNIMQELQYVDYESVAAETLRLILENGGNPMMVVEYRTVFDEIDFGIVFDVTEYDDGIPFQLFESRFKMWLTMIGYGATLKNNKCPLEVLDGYSTDKFKHFENFTYSIERFEKEWIMHIIDVRTNKEVAKL